MKKVLKWGAIICAGLVAIVIAALVIISLVVDVDKYKPEIEKMVSDATQRPFSIGDDLGFTLFPWAGVSLSDIRLGNPGGFAEKNFVTAKSFEVRLKLLPLIFQEIEIKKLVLNEPRVVLLKSKTGAVNWEFPAAKTGSAKKFGTPAAKAPSGGLPISSLVVNDLAVKNGVVIFVDQSANSRRELSAINLTVKDVSMENPVKISFSARLGDKPVSLEGSIGPLGNIMQGGVVSMDLSLDALKQISLKLKGNLENPLTTPGLDVNIAVDPFSPRNLMAALQQPFPLATSDPETLQRVSLMAHVRGSSKNVSVTDGKLQLDESNLNFKLNASEFSRPNLAFDIHLDQINLDRYMPQTADKGKAPAESTTQKKHKTDYTALRQLVMDGLIRIDKLTVSKAKIQDVNLKIAAKNGIFNLNPIKLNLYQGNTVGKASVDVTTDIPRSSVDLKVNNLQVNPLLQDVAQKDILEGTTKAQLSLTMAGDDAAQIKKTLNGDGELLFNDGAIKGIDLAGMVRNVQAAFGLAEKAAARPKTDFTELSAPFTVKNGRVYTPQTSLKSPLLRIIASGNADLVAETLDMRVEPKVVGTIKGQGDSTQRSGLMVPVVVSGSFAKPKFSPDLKSAVSEDIKKKILDSEDGGELLKEDDSQSVKKKAKSLIKGLLGQ